MPKIEDMVDFIAAAFMAIDGINRFVETPDPDEVAYPEKLCSIRAVSGDSSDSRPTTRSVCRGRQLLG